MNFKRKILIAISIIFFAIGGTCLYFYHNLEKYVWPNLVPPAAFWVDMDKPLDQQTALVEIADREFKIPLAYIQSKRPIGQIFKNSILLNVVWPDMQSILDLKTKENYNKVIMIERRHGDILIEAASARSEIGVQVSNVEKGLTKREAIGKFEGLDGYKYYFGTANNPELWSKMYLIRNDAGKIISYIECLEASIEVNSVCNHKFIDKGLIYEIDYNKSSFFAQWKQQQQKAIQFVDGFEIKK